MRGSGYRYPIALLLITMIGGSPLAAVDTGLSPSNPTEPPDEHPLSVGLSADAIGRIGVGLSIEADRESNSQSSPWSKAPYVVAGTAVLYSQDLEIQRWAQAKRSPATDRTAKFAKRFGEAETYAWPMAALFLYSELFDNSHARRTAEYTAEGLVICGLATQLIKYTVRRPRPGDPLGEDRPNEGRAGLSFPSGHTAVAFTVATVLSVQCGNESPAALLAYVLAAMTGWSRINDNAHWASDVLFGSYVGYVSAREAMGSSSDSPDAAGLDTTCPVSLSFSF